MISNFKKPIGQVHITIVWDAAASNVPIRAIGLLKAQVHIDVLANIGLLNMKVHSGVEAADIALSVISRVVKQFHKILVSVKGLSLGDHCGVEEFGAFILSTELIFGVVITTT